MRWKLFIYRENNINTWVAEKAFNKPEEILDMLERLARRCKQNGASEETVEHIREHGKQRRKERN